MKQLDDGWVSVDDEPVNNKAWQYKRLVNPDSFIIRYATPCGDWLEKSASSDELMNLLGALPDPADHTACVMAGYCIMEEDRIIPTLLGSAGETH